MTEPQDEQGVTLYEAVGGMPFFERLVDAFYEGVMPDPVLLPISARTGKGMDRWSEWLAALHRKGRSVSPAHRPGM